jgi:hypothetical protein
VGHQQIGDLNNSNERKQKERKGLAALRWIFLKR